MKSIWQLRFVTACMLFVFTINSISIGPEVCWLGYHCIVLRRLFHIAYHPEWKSASLVDEFIPSIVCTHSNDKHERSHNEDVSGPIHLNAVQMDSKENHRALFF